MKNVFHKVIGFLQVKDLSFEPSHRVLHLSITFENLRLLISSQTKSFIKNFDILELFGPPQLLLYIVINFILLPGNFREHI